MTLSGRLPILAAAIGVSLILVTVLAPHDVIPVLQQLGGIWNFLLLVATAGTIFWFIYSVGLRRILRVRRIARIRGNRLLQEAAARDAEDADKL